MKLCLLVSLCATAVGCGSGTGPGIPIAPVKGVVRLDGDPMASPLVTFYPETGPSGIGIGDENGAFTIRTNGQAGAPVGECVVTVVPKSGANGEIPETDGNEEAYADIAVIDPKYANKGTTDLTVTVPADGILELKLDVSSLKR